MLEAKYDNWNKLKKSINFWNDRKVYPKVWEIWYINMWINIWSESLWKWNDFKRPVLIIKKIWSMFFWFSMTTKWKENNIFYLKIPDNYFTKESYIIKSQFKSLDRKRFIEKIGKLWNKDFYKIKKELQKFIF